MQWEKSTVTAQMSLAVRRTTIVAVVAWYVSRDLRLVSRKSCPVYLQLKKRSMGDGSDRRQKQTQRHGKKRLAVEEIRMLSEPRDGERLPGLKWSSPRRVVDREMQVVLSLVPWCWGARLAAGQMSEVLLCEWSKLCPVSG